LNLHLPKLSVCTNTQVSDFNCGLWQGTAYFIQIIHKNVAMYLKQDGVFIQITGTVVVIVIQMLISNLCTIRVSSITLAIDLTVHNTVIFSKINILFSVDYRLGKW
jgi:hypothetical protein